MNPSTACRAAGILALIVVGCAPIGAFVWADDYLSSAKDQGEGYQIAPGDLISVRVYGQEAVSTRERVRQDGKISLPLLRDVQVEGLTPNALAEQLQIKLKEYIAAPVVSVAVAEVRPLAIPVLGEVNHQGTVTMERGAAGVLDAIAMAGGLTEFAHRDRIFVLRRDSPMVRIRCTFEALTRGGRASALRLRPGDSIVVE